MDRLGIITRRFSWSLLARILVLVFLGATVSAIVLYLNVQERIENDYSSALISIKNLQDVLLLKTLLINAVIGVLILMAVALINLFYSHRVAGPLFRLGREAAKVATGDLTVHVRLRKTDVVVPLAEELTGFADSYRTRVLELDEKVSDVQELTRSTLALMGAGKEPQSIEASVAAIKQKVKDMEETFKEIRL